MVEAVFASPPRRRGRRRRRHSRFQRVVIGPDNYHDYKEYVGSIRNFPNSLVGR
jgi:hypothetical protein